MVFERLSPELSFDHFFLAEKNSGRFLKFLKIIKIPWLIQDNDLPFSYITELQAIGNAYGHW